SSQAILKYGIKMAFIHDRKPKIKNNKAMIPMEIFVSLLVKLATVFKTVALIIYILVSHPLAYSLDQNSLIIFLSWRICPLDGSMSNCLPARKAILPSCTKRVLW